MTRSSASWCGLARNETCLPVSRTTSRRPNSVWKGTVEHRRLLRRLLPISRRELARIGAKYGGDEIEFDADDLLGASGPPQEECAAFLFDDETAEAAWLADEVGALLEQGVAPRDICILTRMRTAEYCATVMGELQAHGIESRLEDAMQDLLSEPVVGLGILAMRALMGTSPRADWGRFRQALAELQGLTGDDVESLASLDGGLQQLRRQLQAATLKPARVREALRTHIEPLFRVTITNRHPQYKRGTFYEDTVNKLCEAVGKASNDTWEGALDVVEGMHAVPVLTIHKSKGLEYSAVFFLGLEDGAFWNFSRTPDEELNTFFVALSRAKRRVAFTFAAERSVGRYSNQSRHRIAEVYELLEDAGVPIVDLTPD